MGFLDQFFKKNTKEETPNSKELAVEDTLAESELHIDQLFAKNFTDKGGKFIFCEHLSHVDKYINLILDENKWNIDNIVCFDPALINHFNLTSPTGTKGDFIITNCESLIAQKGSILFTSNQLKEFKLNELPNNIIVIAKLEQIKENIREAMIKINSSDNLPSNITDLEHFKINEEKDFLTYGRTPKNLYLLLLEDY